MVTVVVHITQQGLLWTTTTAKGLVDLTGIINIRAFVDTHRTEVGIYKRKEESKKTRKHAFE